MEAGRDTGDIYTTPLFWLLKKTLHDRGRYSVFEYDFAQGEGEPHDAITVYPRYVAIPPEFRHAALPSRFVNLMYYRLQTGKARLLCYSEDGEELQAYGWIQSWRPFRRRFAAVADDGLILGPYWTAPKHRHQGLYVALLRHSVFLSGRTKRLIIYTLPGNTGSKRGIARAGFKPIGELTFVAWFRYLVRDSTLSEPCAHQ